MNAVPMTPIEVTSRFRRLSPANPGRLASPHLEIWSARSKDGLWTYERLEMAGTPWVVTHVPTGVEWWEPSLPKARRATATDGLRQVELRIAEIVEANQ